jgi:hypothetical protein
MEDSAQPPTTAGLVGEVLVYAGAVVLMLGLGTLYFDHRYRGATNRTLGIVLTVLGVIGLAIAYTQRKAISADLAMDGGDQETSDR